MFSTRERLAKRTPQKGVDRKNYLTLLVDEFGNATTHEARYQVLANVANFCYDPINYEYVIELGILDIFLTQLEEKADTKLVYYASAGLCNLSLYPIFVDYIIENGGLNLLIGISESKHEETALNAITALHYIHSDKTHELLLRPDLLSCLSKYKESPDKRFTNLATIFLDDLRIDSNESSVYNISNNNMETTNTAPNVPLPDNFKWDMKMLSNRFPYILVNHKSYQKICKIHTTSFTNTPFKVGDKIRIQKTLTQKDLDAFSNLTSDHNPIHAAAGPRRAIVHGALLNGLVAGLIGTHLPGPGTVLVEQTVRFPNKCFVGERLTINVELVDVRKILRVKFYCQVEDEKKVVFEGEAKLVLAETN